MLSVEGLLSSLLRGVGGLRSCPRQRRVERDRRQAGAAFDQRGFGAWHRARGQGLGSSLKSELETEEDKKEGLANRDRLV